MKRTYFLSGVPATVVVSCALAASVLSSPARGQGHWVERARLTLPDAAIYDRLGSSVSIHGDWLAAGATGKDDRGTESGAVVIYHREGEAWNFHTKLLQPDGGPWEHFGICVDFSDEHLIVGSESGSSQRGAAYMYRLTNDNQWIYQQKFKPDGVERLDRFSVDVAVEGRWAIAGWPGYDTSEMDQVGTAVIYRRAETGVWHEHSRVMADGAEMGDFFARNVELSGERAAISAIYSDYNANNSGSVQFFEYNPDADAWEFTQTIGPQYIGYDHQDFGSPLALDGDIAAVGQVGIEEPGVSVFRQTQGSWQQEQYISALDLGLYDEFWLSELLSVNGERVFVGSPGPGHSDIVVLEPNGPGWSEAAPRIVGSQTEGLDRFGVSTDSYGNYLAAGSIDFPVDGEPAGAVYVFERVPEPTSAALLGVAAAVLLRRLSRRPF